MGILSNSFETISQPTDISSDEPTWIRTARWAVEHQNEVLAFGEVAFFSLEAWGWIYEIQDGVDWLGPLIVVLPP